MCSMKYNSFTEDCLRFPNAYVFAFHWAMLKLTHMAYPEPATFTETWTSIILALGGIFITTCKLLFDEERMGIVLRIGRPKHLTFNDSAAVNN